MGGCVQHHFSEKKTSMVTYCVYYLVELNIKFPAI